MKFIYKYNSFLESINTISDSYETYHATNTTWKIPEIKGFGFHSGTLKSAKDRMNSFNMSINPHILKLKITIKNPLYLSRDYIFHDSLTRVATQLYKDDIISKKEKDEFIRIYSDDATFDNLRKLLHDKYGYDGVMYKNNIEDRGSISYICFYAEQIEILDYDFKSV